MDKKRYAMVLKEQVIDVILADSSPEWGPDPEGNPVAAVPCDEDVIIGMGYDFENKEFGTYTPPPVIPEPTPQPAPPLSETERAILDTAVNTEYLVCLKDMGL